MYYVNYFDIGEFRGMYAKYTLTLKSGQSILILARLGSDIKLNVKMKPLQ
ncbi:hypothetical protein GCM10007981_17220 [Thermocladium modestius]|uniref:Uncharacterized protein n=1 Tax=Thermocladium modestius TaxID=62609 RepID=A0A830GVF9_9CREN|nr:hypothetical protein GCM10007981_17220 [Thermocladium modestius]